MTATDEETLLNDFLDEEVPCEGCPEDKGDHPADIYIKFTCDHCSDVVLGPVCIECHEDFLGVLAQIGGVLCSCGKFSGLSSYVVVGPVR
jgi:hypothetical protein